jgi:hypothetical protein
MLKGIRRSRAMKSLAIVSQDDRASRPPVASRLGHAMWRRQSAWSRPDIGTTEVPTGVGVRGGARRGPAEPRADVAAAPSNATCSPTTSSSPADLFRRSSDKLLDAVVTITIFDGKVAYDRESEPLHAGQ